MLDRDGLRDRAAHRGADEVSALEPECVEQADRGGVIARGERRATLRDGRGS